MYPDRPPPNKPSFLQLFHIAAKCDCLYLLDFYCQLLFSHNRTSHLSEEQQAFLAKAAHDDIIAVAAEQNRLLPPRDQLLLCGNEPYFIKPMPIEAVESGLAGDEEKYLFNLWHENKGVIQNDDRLTKLSSKFILTLPEADAGKVPELTFAGRDSTFRRMFPAAIANNRPVVDVLPEKYVAAATDAYHMAIAGEPSFDIQRTGPLLGPKVPNITQQRLVLKFKSSSGFERVFSLIRVLQIHEASDRVGSTALNLEN